MIQRILAVETSCDETSIAIIDSIDNQTIHVHHHEVFSQIDIHKEYGGVFPAVAKRMHAVILPKQIQKVLETFSQKEASDISEETITKAKEFLQREPQLFEELLKLRKEYEHFPADILAVSTGPGLEPTLWVGVTAMQAIATLWNLPLLPVNHMLGHLASALSAEPKNFKTPQTLLPVEFPLITLLISGKHTEIVYFENWNKRIKLGSTRDDASGECYDKTGRMLGFDYPAGKDISMAAQRIRESFTTTPDIEKDKELKKLLPQPMKHSGDYDFSFSGLKTATKRVIENSDQEFTKNEMAYAIQYAINEVMETKTKKALKEYSPKTVIVAGGVSADGDIRNRLAKICEEFNITYLPAARSLCGDNGLMIALAAHVILQNNLEELPPIESLQAIGRWNIVDSYENALRNY